MQSVNTFFGRLSPVTVFLFPEKGTRLMRKFTQFAVEFLKREDGPTAVEYAVMLALIIVVCITAITTLGSNANGTFTKVGSAVNVAGS
jgi:pilus assembly protein Flp/PilA